MPRHIQLFAFRRLFARRRCLLPPAAAAMVSLRSRLHHISAAAAFMAFSATPTTLFAFLPSSFSFTPYFRLSEGLIRGCRCLIFTPHTLDADMLMAMLLLPRLGFCFSGRRRWEAVQGYAVRDIDGRFSPPPSSVFDNIIRRGLPSILLRRMPRDMPRCPRQPCRWRDDGYAFLFIGICCYARRSVVPAFRHTRA